MPHQYVPPPDPLSWSFRLRFGCRGRGIEGSGRAASGHSRRTASLESAASAPPDWDDVWLSPVADIGFHFPPRPKFLAYRPKDFPPRRAPLSTGPKPFPPSPGPPGPPLNPPLAVAMRSVRTPEGSKVRRAAAERLASLQRSEMSGRIALSFLATKLWQRSVSSRCLVILLDSAILEWRMGGR